MTIQRNITPITVNGVQCRPSRTMAPTSITIHNTGNTAATATAAQHARAQVAGNLAAQKVAVHYYVDDTGVYQCLEDNWQGWHAGDGGNTKGGNYTSIGIEVCENKGINQRQAFVLAAELVRSLMAKHGITKVVRHKDWTGKDCPHILNEGRDGMTWDWFVAMCKTPLSVAECKEIIRTECGIDKPADVWALLDKHPFAADLYRKIAARLTR